jgi:hypothetical protein
MAPPKAGRRKYVRYSEDLARRLCERLEAGELLHQLGREPGMPSAEGVAKWARQKPEFAERLLAARRAGGWAPSASGPAFTYSPEVGHEIFERLCEGQSLTAIGRDPTMPSLSTLFYWRRRIPEFEDQVQLGMRIRAERVCDESLELAEAATPETAYLTHVRLTHLRWMTQVMAPRVFRLKAVEPAGPPQERMKTVLIRHFRRVTDPVTGAERVASFLPNPETGRMEEEIDPVA